MTRPADVAGGANGSEIEENFEAASTLTDATLTTDQAQRLTDRIERHLDTVASTITLVVPLIEKAKSGNAHIALGYRSWTEYVVDKFGASRGRIERAERVPLVQLLSDTGLSTRAIAPIVGADHSTVVRDLSGGADAPPEDDRPASAPSGQEAVVRRLVDERDWPEDEASHAVNQKYRRARRIYDPNAIFWEIVKGSEKVTGTDGKSYPKKKAKKRPRPSPDPPAESFATKRREFIGDIGGMPMFLEPSDPDEDRPKPRKTTGTVGKSYPSRQPRSVAELKKWLAEGERVVTEVLQDVLAGQADPAFLDDGIHNLDVLRARLQSASSGKAAGTCRSCGQGLMFVADGRTQCERCRLDEAAAR